MSHQYTGRWVPMRDKAMIPGTLPWFVRRDLGVVRVDQDYALGIDGKVRRFATKEAAQLAADKLNAGVAR